MELLLELDVCKGLSCNEILELSESDKKRIKKTVDLDHVTEMDFVNIGPGADLIVLLLIVSIGLQLIKVGAEINDGIDGWIEIGKKLQKLFKRKKIVSVDMDGATALAIGCIATQDKIITLEKIQETVINLVDVSGMIPINSGLSRKPHNYYIQTYRINGEDIYVMGIKSTGEVEIIKHFGFNPYGIIEVEKD